MLKIRKAMVFACMFVLMGLTSCINKRGVIDDHIYFSTHYPNIQVMVAKDFSYEKGKPNAYKHQFINEEEHRFIFIHYTLHPSNENRIDYYENPEHWIYSNWPDTVEIEKGRMMILGKKWYYRDSVWHSSTASCAMIRDLGLFTSRHDVLKMLYVRELPPFKCGQWKTTSSLTNEQEQLRSEFLSDLASDMKITNYPLE